MSPHPGEPGQRWWMQWPQRSPSANSDHAVATPDLLALLNLCLDLGHSGHQLVRGRQGGPIQLRRARITVTVDDAAAAEFDQYATATSRRDAASELIGVGARVRAIAGAADSVLITDAAGFDTVVALADTPKPSDGGNHPMTAPTDHDVLELTNDWEADLTELRVRGPITRVWFPPGDLKAWLVTDPECIRLVTTDPRIAKNPRHWPALSEGRIGTDHWILPWVAMDSALTNDGTVHTHLRNLLRPAFLPAAMTVLRTKIAAITDEVLDTLAKTGPDQALDLRAAFTDVIPIRVICEIMGVPAELATRLCACTAATLDIALTPEQARANFGRLAHALEDLITHKRAHRGQDLTSQLLAAHEAGQLSEKQLRDAMTLMLTAGYETVATLLDHAIVEQLTHPWVRQGLAAAKLTWRALIEETLRMWAPLRNTPVRFPLEPVEIAGVVLEPGELIFLSYGAAGRDLRLYPDADTFDPTRERIPHLAFGHGRHYCLGAPLARLQAEIALSKLHTRFPAMRLAIPSSQLEQRTSVIVAGHREIPVFLGPPAQTDTAVRP